MHFSTIYILKNETLENVGLNSIEQDFYERFCYGCGENVPKYQSWCDWFQIGGRWCDELIASKGINGEKSWYNENMALQKNHYSIVEIKDLIEPLDKNNIYAFATKSRIYQDSNDKYDYYLNAINNKTIKGVIVLIDCHD